MEIENPMVNDAYWGDFGEDFGEEENDEEEYEDDYEWLERIEEEEEKEKKLPLFVFSRMNDGYHF
jgi:hypothetical protein